MTYSEGLRRSVRRWRSGLTRVTSEACPSEDYAEYTESGRRSSSLKLCLVEKLEEAKQRQANKAAQLAVLENRKQLSPSRRITSPSGPISLT